MDIYVAFQHFLRATGLKEIGREGKSGVDYGAFSRAFYELRDQHGWEGQEVIDSMVTWYNEEKREKTKLSILRVIEGYHFPRAWVVLLARENVG